MPDTLHVMLGNLGDCVIALPSLKRWADEHGRPAPVLTTDYCAPLFEGCSYVKTAVVPSTYHDLPHVLAMLKTEMPNQPVKNLQFYGSGAPQILPSFWHEQMYLAGLLKNGEDLPLVFDRRDSTRERKLINDFTEWHQVANPRPVILFCGKGNSSPLKDAKALKEILWHRLGEDFNMVDLGDVKAEKPFDLLGLYDHAAALISIDTLHIHLSKASNVPVFAIARDYPDRWHGTPQLDRFAWYCRYSDVLERVDELVEVLRNTVSGKPRETLQLWKPELLGERKQGYNPSVLQIGSESHTSSRYHPDPKSWKTQLILDGLPVHFPFPVSKCAHEDMRLFTYRGELWATYVCSRLKDGQPRCVTGYGQLVKTEKFWAIKEHFQPAMIGNDWTAMSKNVVGFQHEDSICLIWKGGYIIKMNHGQPSLAVKGYFSDPATWPYGEIRGGTSPLPYKGKWLRFFHSRIWPEGTDRWRYHVGALVMEPEPPFATLAVSSKPILSGDESGDPMIKHWKHSVVFPLGAVEDGDGWLVSLGINDAHCALLKLNEGNLNL